MFCGDLNSEKFFLEIFTVNELRLHQVRSYKAPYTQWWARKLHLNAVSKHPTRIIHPSMIKPEQHSISEKWHSIRAPPFYTDSLTMFVRHLLHRYEVSITDPADMISVFYHRICECGRTPTSDRVSYVLLRANNLQQQEEVIPNMHTGGTTPNITEGRSS